MLSWYACPAYYRRKFFEAVPKETRKKQKPLDINSEQETTGSEEEMAEDDTLLPAEKGVNYAQNHREILMNYSMDGGARSPIMSLKEGRNSM